MPHPLIDRAPGNGATSLTTYTTHTREVDTRKYIYIYTLNPVESNHRDGPTGHKKTMETRIIKNIFNKSERRCMDVKTQKACKQGWEANIGPKITSI